MKCVNFLSVAWFQAFWQLLVMSSSTKAFVLTFRLATSESRAPIVQSLSPAILSKDSRAQEANRKKTINVDTITNPPSSILAALLVASTIALADPMPSLAATPASTASLVFNHEYADQLHPNCLRKIKVDPDGNTFHYSGTAVGSKGGDPVRGGCTPAEIKEFGIRRFSVDGQILGNGNLRISGVVDGSIQQGVWEAAGSATTSLGFENVDGIRWNDGSKWTVKDKPVSTKIGEWIFYAYIGFSSLAGVKGVYDGIQRKRD